MPSVFHADEPRPEVRQFATNFQKRFGAPPNAGSALGYDAVRLLAAAMRQAHSAAPEPVAAALHALRGWQGVTGRFSFDTAGDLVDKPIVTHGGAQRPIRIPPRRRPLRRSADRRLIQQGGTPLMSAERERILRANGARGDEVAELLRYTESGFDLTSIGALTDVPLDDEAFVDAWSEYASEADHVGAGPTLRRHLIQLRFAVEHGMSAREDFLAATRRGILPSAHTPAAAFVDENGLSIMLHQTPAGRLPIVIADARADFETLVQALTRRNEPVPIPASMGACIIGGYNNWSRVARSSRTLGTPASRRQASGAWAEDAWQSEFRRIMPQKDLYQDRFVVLSSGPYSGTPAAVLGLADDEWRRLSLVIRLEHECAHYFTKRVFGSMRNSLLDELIADYIGIVAARGRFEPEWFVRFMGVENPNVWRPDGRLANYRGDPPLSDGAFVVLQTLVRVAAETLDRFDALLRDGSDVRARSLDDTARTIAAIAGVGLERMAEPRAEDCSVRCVREDARGCAQVVK